MAQDFIAPTQNLSKMAASSSYIYSGPTTRSPRLSGTTVIGLYCQKGSFCVVSCLFCYFPVKMIAQSAIAQCASNKMSVK